MRLAGLGAATTVLGLVFGAACGGPERPPHGPGGLSAEGTAASGPPRIALPADLVPARTAFTLAAHEPPPGALRALAFAPTTRPKAPETLGLLEEGALLAAADGVFTLHFDRPVAEGAALGRPLSKGPLRFDDAGIGGEYTWVDPRTLRFRATGTYEPSLPVGVHLDPKLTATGGAGPHGGDVRFEVKLDPLAWVGGQPIGWRPVKGKPRLVALSPRGGLWQPGRPLLLLFDQPVDPTALGARAKLWRITRSGAKDARDPVALAAARPPAGPGGKLPWPGADARNVVALAALVAPPEGSTLVLAFDDALPRSPTLDDHKEAWLRTPPPFRGSSVWCPSEYSCAEDHKDGTWEVKSWAGHLAVSLSARPATAALKDRVAIAPAPKSWRVWAEDSALHVEVEYGAGKDHVVTVLPTLADETGRPLSAPIVLKLHRADHPPAARLPSGEVVLDRGGPHGGKLPLATVNLGAAELRVRPLADAELRDAVRAARGYGDESFEDVMKKGAAILPLPRGKGGAWTTRKVDLAKESGAAGATLFAVEFESKPTDKDHGPALYERALVQVTDLGVSATVLETGVLVWVTRLATAAPVDGADVELRLEGKTVAGRTGPDGTAFIATPSAGDEGAIVLARTKDDRAYTALGWDGRLDNASLGVPSVGGPPTEVMAFTDRGIYRPPDVVHLKALARVRGGGTFHPPAGKRVEAVLRVTGSEGEVVHEARAALGTHGSASFDVPVLPGWKLGGHAWRVSIVDPDAPARAARPDGGGDGRFDGGGDDMGDGDGDGDGDDDGSGGGGGGGAPSASGSFDVAELRTPEFEVAVTAGPPGGKPLMPGEKLHAKVEAHYLAGGPVAFGHVTWTLRRRGAELSLPGWKGFVLPRAWGDEEVASGTAQLDAAGALALDLVPRLDDAAGPVRLTLEAEVTDDTFQSVSAHGDAYAHARTEYAIVRALPMKKDKGVFEVAVVTPDGKPVAGRDVSLAVLERYDYGYWESDGGGEEYDEGSDYDEWEVTRCALKSAAKPVRCSFTGWPWGSFVGRVRLVDKLGRIVATEARTEASGDAGSGGDEVERRTAVSVPAGKHAVGETVTVTVRSPFKEARGILTVLRDEVLHTQVVPLTAGLNKLTLPVDARYGPNAFVAVHVVSPRLATKLDARGRDTGRPSWRAGAAALEVALPDGGPLKAALTTDADRYRPRDTAKVRVAVTDAGGKAAAGTEVALWAVDEGVLMLTHYETPNGASAFDPVWWPWLTIHDSRWALPVELAMLMDKSDPGGGPELEDEGAAPMVRRDFERTVLWLPHLVTDAAGVVTAELKVPDNLTAFRVMAVALDDRGRGASADKRIESSLPLQVTPALPRFATLGDRFEARAVVRNRTDAPLHVKVHFASSGPGVLSLAPGAAAAAEVDVPPGLTRAVTFPVEAAQLGSAEVAFRAVTGAGGPGDEVRVPLLVTPPSVMLSGATVGAADGAATLAVDVPGDALRGLGALELVMAYNPATGLGQSLEELVQYPHGCVEQTTSSTYPLIALRDILPALGYTRHPRAELDRLARAGLDRLAKMRTDSGGLAYWPGDTDPHPYGTAYAMLALSEAHRAGLPLAPGLLEGATAYLRGLLDGTGDKSGMEAGSPHASEGGPLGGLDGRAYAVMVLVTAGEKLPSHLEALYLKRAGLDPFGMAALALALVRADPRDVRARELLGMLDGWFDADGKLVARAAKPRPADFLPFGSEARTAAFALAAAAEIDVTAPLATRLARGLMRAHEHAGWSSTQETAFTLMGLATFFRHTTAPAGSAGFAVKLGGKDVAPAEELPGGARRFVLDPADVAAAARGAGGGEAVLSLTGAGHWYLDATLRYARPLEAAPKDGRAAGIAVARRVERLDGGELGTVVAPGTAVRVRALVELDKTLEYVAVEVPLPAGLEAVDPALATSGAAAGETASPDAARGKGVLSHAELHDDRVVFFLDYAAAGKYEFAFLARATTRGGFVVPPVHAYAMYDGDTYGLGAPARLAVDGGAP
ncbi:MAG TPA: alpha-2-macroglobulin family protein [Myxococcota bacterium]|nr:alpha-2-macroglobulin family protein [Myxococcota bacterium]